LQTQLRPFIHCWD